MNPQDACKILRTGKFVGVPEIHPVCSLFVMADILLLEGTFNAQKIDFHLFKCRACFLNMPLDSTKFNTRTQQMGYGTWYENILLFPGDIVMTNSKITKIV